MGLDARIESLSMDGPLTETSIGGDPVNNDDAIIQVTAQTGNMILDDQHLNGKKRQKSGSVTPVATTTPDTIIMSVSVPTGKNIEEIVGPINSVICRVDCNAANIKNIY